MATRSKQLAALAFVVGILVGAGAFALVLRTRHRAESSVQSALAGLPREPSAYIPAGARGVAIVDVERLRRAPVLASWFTGTPAHDEPCEAGLLRRVRAIAIAVGGGLDQVGVAFAGDLPPAELIACARARLPRESVMERSSYRGIELTRLAPRRSADLLPSSTVSEIVYLPSGVVLAGSFEMVRRMIDRGLSPGGSDVPTAATEMRRRIGPGFDAVAAFELPTDSANDRDALSPAFAHVRGVAIGLHGDDALEASALFGCDDYDSPREVSDAITQLRQSLAEALRLPSLAEPFRRARVERGATDVRVATQFTAGELAGMELMLRSLLSTSPSEQTPSASSSPPP